MRLILSILILLSINLGANISMTKEAMQEYKKGNISKAVRLLGKSCNGNEMQACVNLGYIYTRGLSVKKEFTKGSSLLKKACQHGNNKGCVVLGNAILEEEGNLWYNFKKNNTPDPKDIKEHNKRLDMGKKYLLKACESGSSMGCSSLGGVYWNYMQQNGGIKKKPKIAKKAFDILTKACDLKDARTCMQLGYTYENIGEKKFSAAAKIYKKACDFGYQKACSSYNRLHYSGY